MKVRFVSLFLFVVIAVPLILSASHSGAQPVSSPRILSLVSINPTATQATSNWDHAFQVRSTTFENEQLIPASMVFSGTLGSVCTGGNQSPELSWTSAGRSTHSYAVTLFDVTANFVHWGVYNIPADVTELAEGAGNPSSTTELQVFNDAGIQGYSGPCPPPDIVPNGIHRYVFTVYALDRMLDLTPSPDFPPEGAALYRAMLNHVVDQTSITGLFNCTNQSSCS
jgi:Raf kinase inhibitor-like YbhB/YbcL family protein